MTLQSRRLLLGFAGGMVLFSLILTAIQCSFIHVHIDNSLADRPVVLRRGLSSLAFLPPPLDPEILIDTGLNQQDISSTQRDSLEGVRIGRWTDASYLARLLIPYLNRGSAGRWLCYQDNWQQGLRLLSQSQYDKNQLLALIAIDPAAAQQALQVLANDADKTVRAFSAAVLEGLAPYDRASFISADTVVRTHPDSGPAAPAIIPLLTSPHRSDSAAGNLANLTLAELLQALDNSASDIRSNAAKILKTKHLNTQQAQYVTSALLARLRTRDIYERLATLKILQNKTIINYISQNDAAFSALLEQFHDSSHRVRQAMVVLLRNMTLHPAQTRLAVAYLTGLLENVDKDIRFSATAALQHLILTEEQ
jgi:hypothetical protein